MYAGGQVKGTWHQRRQEKLDKNEKKYMHRINNSALAYIHTGGEVYVEA